MNLINNFWTRHLCIATVAGFFAVFLFFAMPFSLTVTHASNSHAHLDSTSPAPIATPVPPEVTTEQVVITETVIMTDEVIVTDTIIVTETQVITETFELTGTVEGTVILPIVEVISRTESITRTEIMTSSMIVTRTETILLDVGVVQGQVWHDLDNNGTSNLSDGDEALDGVIVRLSSTDGIFLETSTNADGVYWFENLPLDRAYEIIIDSNTLPDNKTFRPNYDPDGTQNGITVLMLTADDPIVDDSNFSFAAGDYGDLPDSYSTSAPNGAFHATVTGGGQITLGSDVSAEVAAQVSADARGDGEDNGVTKLGAFTPGETNTLRVTVEGIVPDSGATLGLWFDWNDDGMFSEEEFVSYTVFEGGNLVQVAVPATYVENDLPVRARLFASDGVPGGTIDWTDFQGPAVNGEVEDYIFTSATAVSLSQMNVMDVKSGTTTLTMISIIMLSTVTLGVNRLSSER